ncbi:MAG: hypothetical protein EPN21_05700 [Methylococcaceae bacterium]|nr:MAG: hypothetical protein EPN21_05700 [Methylococcaceae bacterium]
MTVELAMLQSNVEATRQRIDKLAYSLGRIKSLFLLTIQTMMQLGDDQQESIDALILRYSQSVSMIQDQLFRGIAYIEQESLSDKSNRDKALLMEKLGAIRSADEFGSAALLRNKFAHHYPEDIERRIERLNLVVHKPEYVIKMFCEIVAYLERKGFISS